MSSAGTSLHTDRYDTVVNAMHETVYRWRGSDPPSLEVLRLHARTHDLFAQSRLVNAGPEPFVVDYEWLLDSSRRTRSLTVLVRQHETVKLSIERVDSRSWRIDGSPRPDLDGCDEIDLSVTPFCNTLALLRFAPPPGGPGEITALYVSFPDLTLSPSRQRYERLDDRTFKYIDLGVQKGFEARLAVDHAGFVRSYEGLFERL